MHVIHSAPKELFEGIWGVSRLEKLVFALILILLGLVATPMVVHAMPGEPPAGDSFGLVWLGSAAALYLVGGSVVTRIVENHNRPIQCHIDSVDKAIAERAGRSFNRDMTPVLIGVAMEGGHVFANVHENDVAYDFEFSGAGDSLVVRAEGTVKRSPVRSAMLNLKASTRFA